MAKTETKKVIVNGEEQELAKKIKLWKEDGFDRHKIRSLILEKREGAKIDEGSGT